MALVAVIHSLGIVARAADPESNAAEQYFLSGQHQRQEVVVSQGECEPAWTPDLFFPGPPGMDNGVNALAVFDDGSGSGPALYAGGNFTTAGGVAANYIAKWDGSSWSPLGTGMNFTVLALAVFDDGSGGGPALYAGGEFSTAGGVPARYIAKWDGSAWSALGTGTSNTEPSTRPHVFALTVFDDGLGGGPALYAGGYFNTAGGLPANRIAKWDGSSWSALGEGVGIGTFPGLAVLSLTVFDDGSGGGPALYAGGRFSNAGGIVAKRIAKWDGASWSALGDGLDVGTFPGPDVSALAVFDDGSGSGPALYAGGFFGLAGSVPANDIAKWDGTSWSALGTGMVGGTVSALTVFDDGTGSGPALYAGGNFFGAGGVPASRIAKWDGSVWSPLGTGLSGAPNPNITPSVRALAQFNGGDDAPSLYAGGFFTTAGGAPSSFIARWTGCAAGPTPCPGDTNGDHVVNFIDLNAVLSDFGATGAGLAGDVNGDEVVNFADLNEVLSAFGTECE
jgi:hypothetical protein